MLVLSRRVDEAIRVGDDTRILIVKLANGAVKVGVEAPHGIPVDREEVYFDKQREAGGVQGTPSEGMEAPPSFVAGESSFNN